jgi:chromosome segregation ATPase
MALSEEQAKRILEKLQQVLKVNTALRRDKELLEQEIAQYKNRLTQAQEAIGKLEQQVELLKFTGTSMTEEEKKQFERRINTYLKEIDKCIAYLEG